MVVMLTGREAIHIPIQGGRVHVAARVLPEGRQAAHPQPGGVVVARAARREPYRVDVRLAVVAVEVAPAEPRQGRVAHHVAADERAEAVLVGGRDLRLDGPWSAAGSVAVEALEDAPAVVGAAAGALRLDVDLLELVLADVPDRQVARPAVEAEPVRVPQAVGPDLRPRARTSDERIVARGAVAASRQRVDTHQLAEQRVEPLPRAERVALAAPVAESRVEHPVRAELELPPIV